MSKNTTSQFVTLYNANHTGLVAWTKKAFSLLSDDEADDIVSSVWAQLWDTVSTPSDPQQAPDIINIGYIRTACRNMALAYLRERAHYETESMCIFNENEDDKAVSLTSDYDYKLWEEQNREEQKKELIRKRIHLVNDELQKLSENHRQLLVGHYIDKKPYSELAEELGFKSADVAKQLASKEIKHLRAVLRKAA